LGRAEMSNGELGRVEVLSRVKSEDLRLVDAAGVAAAELSAGEAAVEAVAGGRTGGGVALQRRAAIAADNSAPDRLRPQVLLAARPLLTHGAGAMEKNLEVMTGRRLKRWGMRWTRPGALNLRKLRLWIARCGTNWFEALKPHASQLTNA